MFIDSKEMNIGFMWIFLVKLKLKILIKFQT